MQQEVKDFTISWTDKKTKKTIARHIPGNKIFRIPDEDENPMIFWVWHRLLKPAFTCWGLKIPVIIVNLHGIRSFEATNEAEFKRLYHYISSVMVEELTHCCTKKLKGHENWINYLMELHEECD